MLHSADAQTGLPSLVLDMGYNPDVARIRCGTLSQTKSRRADAGIARIDAKTFLKASNGLRGRVPSMDHLLEPSDLYT